ncbi:DHA2 family efflux MFS transporter permease subunit [Sphingomonas bacterium]|uniref:DHA2 family efflux MFS transporter permease subunit n=1 Tax=Sphingomonas bacterium TaxID=1895847 RepID=UPI0020C6598B|nr:DHA2 family efflux MFS transporter permease subunit [Sphingomonas bacterium]
MSAIADEPPLAEGPALLRWLGFAAMALGLFMSILDMQIVATSLPVIQASLRLDPQQMSWIQTAYIIAEVVSIPITGFLTRVLTMRGLFVVGVLAFVVASAGCAASGGFAGLIVWRVIQGFAAGTLIPAVFSAVFLLFPPSREAFATSIAGVLAVLAPTIGPIVGGYVTQTFNWHWLFLINVVPGLAAAAIGFACLPREVTRLALVRALDLIGLAALAAALTSLVLALKLAPDHGWASMPVAALLVLTLASAVLFVRRSLTSASPVADLRVLADARVAAGCALNFVFGFGLFGSVFLMPVFLILVRGHNALDTGRVMLVTGVAQLLAAPVAVVLEKRIEPRTLSLFGFTLFGVGLLMSGHATPDTDYPGMFAGQAVRGAAVMFCLLPPTRLALGHLPLAAVPNASGLFNVTRNLGGAIGLALIDTIMFGRTPIWGRWIVQRLLAGDVSVARAVGIPIDDFLAARGQPIDADTRELLRPMVEKLALVHAMNEAWLAVAAITIVAGVAIIAWLVATERSRTRGARRTREAMTWDHAGA